MIRLYADKTELKVLQTETMVSRALNVYFVRFKLSVDWRGLSKIACFRIIGDVPEGTETEYYEVLGSDRVCTIPFSITEFPDVEVQAGIYGVEPETKEVVLPTIWVSLGIVQQGTLLVKPVEEPPDEPEEPDIPPIEGEVTVEQIEGVVSNYIKKNPIQYNTIVGVPEPISNKQLGEILK